MKIQQPLWCVYAVTRQWFNSAHISSLFFSPPFSLLICSSHCTSWSFFRWQPSQVGAVRRVMFCARLYTQTSLWRMSLLEKFLHIHLAAYYRSCADDFLICSPSPTLRVDCEPDAVALLSAEIGHKMSWSKFCFKSKTCGDSTGQFLLSKKCFIAVRYVWKLVKVFPKVLTVKKKCLYYYRLLLKTISS